MANVIKLLATADGSPSPHDGEYVQSYTPDGGEGRGRLVTTPEIGRALRFKDSMEAFEAWRAVSRTHPVRIDGKPNRPLTMWTMTPESVE
jgi:hypothetical protein